MDSNVGVIVRVAFDEGMLTGKYTKDHLFPKDDFRSKYFEGDRMPRAVSRVEAIKGVIKETGYSMPQAALKFVLSHPAVSTLITGIRNEDQAAQNIEVSDMTEMPDELINKLQEHTWLRSFWYNGK